MKYKLFFKTIVYLFLFTMFNSYAEFNESNSLNPLQKEQLYKSLSYELRCPQCQNQSLYDSNAMISQDLKNEIIYLIKSGYNKDSIKQYMVNRYGEFILYKPRLSKKTYLLWFAPIFLLIIAIFLLFLIIKKHNKKNKVRNTLSQQEKLKIQRLLGKAP